MNATTQWFYVDHSGIQQGPVLPAFFQDALRRGELQLETLVWRDGLGQWVPLAQAATELGMMGTTPHSASGIASSSITTPTGAPSLWNPNAAALDSLLFTPVFGAYLHSRNWIALGESGKAAKSLQWMYAGIALLVIIPFLPGSGAARLISIVFIVSWWTSSAKEQVTYVKERFGESYPRRPWLVPVLAALGAAFVYVLAIGLVLTVFFPELIQ
jgi:hypothetical protein